jgi:hypothetical protein
MKYITILSIILLSACGKDDTPCPEIIGYWCTEDQRDCVMFQATGVIGLTYPYKTWSTTDCINLQISDYEKFDYGYWFIGKVTSKAIELTRYGKTKIFYKQ